jgi:hypothetical protein
LKAKALTADDEGNKKRFFAKSPESQARLSLFSGFHPNYFKGTAQIVS